MFESREIQIPAKDVRSLCWDGNTLIDWVTGGNRYHLDGQFEPRHVAYSYVFDAATVSPSGEYAAIYAKLGTKGLILHQGKIIREIERSSYYANAYEYPITLFRLSNGQEVLAHCPEHYNQLEIDDLATGERLTSLETRKPSDFFFSRLVANIEGSFLFSAGWHWQPVDHIKVFDVGKALKAASHLDGKGLDLDTWADHSSACFLDNNQLVVALSEQIYEGDDEVANPDEKKDRPPFSEVRVFDLNEIKLVSTILPDAMLGTLMPVGKRHDIGFHEYPKLFDLQTGKVVQRWPHIESGEQKSSIIWGINTLPAMAFDAANWRFAVAGDSEIKVVQLWPD